MAPSCFHQRASEYGVEPPMLNWTDRPSIEGETTFWPIEKLAVGPFPPAPAHVVQLCQPVNWSMSLITFAVEGGAGRPGAGVGVGVGAGVPPDVTFRVIDVVKTAPVLSQA